MVNCELAAGRVPAAKFTLAVGKRQFVGALTGRVRCFFFGPNWIPRSKTRIVNTEAAVGETGDEVIAQAKEGDHIAFSKASAWFREQIGAVIGQEPCL